MATDLLDQSTLSQAELRALLEADEREMSVVFSDPFQPDNPMIYVSDEFETQTGYAPEEAIGQNCRFLQGPGTNPHAIEAIRQGLKAETRLTCSQEKLARRSKPQWQSARASSGASRKRRPWTTTTRPSPGGPCPLKS